MAKSTGIDLGDQVVKAVELDGSYRKTRLLRHRIEPIGHAAAADGEERAIAVVAAVKAAMHAIRAGGDMRIGWPSREAVLRTLDMPFTGHDAIRKVVKSEVEGEIHSHAVDDMVVDFHEVAPNGEGGTRVIVAAVPKVGLRPYVDAFEHAGIEFEIIDLDTMALWRVADWCGAFAPPAAEADSDKPVALPVEGKKARTAVLDLGARSTRVLLVDGGNLVDMRTLRLGSASVAEEIAREYGVSPATAEVAVQSCLRSGQDYDAEAIPVVPVVPAVKGGESAKAEVEPAPAPAAVAVRIPADAVVQARDSYLQRLRRELVRFLASTGGTDMIESVWYTGGGSRMQGAGDVLTEAFGKRAEPLRVMERLQHGLSPDEAAELEPVLSTAIGLALAPMGGPRGFNLRQEDLAFTRGFDRIKFPLAIFCMVALFTVVVWGVKLTNDRNNIEYELGRSYAGAKSITFHGMLGAIMPRDGSWFMEPRNGIDTRAAKKLYDDVEALPVKDRIKHVRDWLRSRVVEAQNKTGIYEDLGLESGLAVLARMAEVLQRREAELGRYLVTKIDLKVSPQKGTSRYLNFTMAFRVEDFRGLGDIVVAAFADDFGKPDSPFARWAEAAEPYKDYRFTDSDQSGVKGGYCNFRILLKDSFQPFSGTPGPARLGAADVPLPGRQGTDGKVAQTGKEADK